MLVEFVLSMDDLVVDGRNIDRCVIRWVSELDQHEILELSQQWINTQNFLTRRMIGLERVGESSLSIEPIEHQSALSWY